MPDHEHTLLDGEKVLADTENFLNRMHKHRDFVQRYSVFRERIVSYFSYRLRDRMQVEDLTSQVFMKAYDKFDDYDDVYAFSTWLYTIARNELIDQLRTKITTAPLEQALDVPDDDRAFYTLIDDVIDAEKIRRHIDDLPSNQAEAVYRRHFLFEDIADIAAHFHKSNEATRQLISRGCRRLQEMLQESET